MMPQRLVRATGWFLALSYGVGAPVAAVLELRAHVLSQRFGYSVAFILAVCAVQLVCAAFILTSRFAVWAACILSITTVGAIVSHLGIGSPATAMPALVFTVLQVWYGVANWRGRSGHDQDQAP